MRKIVFSNNRLTYPRKYFFNNQPFAGKKTKSFFLNLPFAEKSAKTTISTSTHLAFCGVCFFLKIRSKRIFACPRGYFVRRVCFLCAIAKLACVWIFFSFLFLSIKHSLAQCKKVQSNLRLLTRLICAECVLSWRNCNACVCARHIFP